MALVLPALTDCRWWFESLLVHSGVSSATRRKATGADKKKENEGQLESEHKRVRKTSKYGIQWKPEEFFVEAKAILHPKNPQKALPNFTACFEGG